MDAVGAVDAQNAPTAPWKTAQNAVPTAPTRTAISLKEEEERPYELNVASHTKFLTLPFVRSIKEEYLNRVIPLGEYHLRRTIADFRPTTMASGTIRASATN